MNAVKIIAATIAHPIDIGHIHPAIRGANFLLAARTLHDNTAAERPVHQWKNRPVRLPDNRLHFPPGLLDIGPVDTHQPTRFIMQKNGISHGIKGMFPFIFGLFNLQLRSMQRIQRLLQACPGSFRLRHTLLQSHLNRLPIAEIANEGGKHHAAFLRHLGNR